MPGPPSPPSPKLQSGTLERGLQACQRRAWAQAHAALAAADGESRLSAEHLEQLALAAYFVGRDEEYLGALQRAFSEFLDHGASRRAIRCAFWIGIWFLLRGEQGRSNGWLSRVQRLLGAEGDCVEQGYPLIASSTRRIGAGDLCGAEVDAATAAELGERFGDVDLSACARHLLGRALLQQGRISEGLASLDEAMLVVTGGSVSPLVTGLTYCGVIEGYQQVYALARAREWTEALSRWCDEQPEMLAFSGTCLVHRAELMQLLGSWPGALAEAQRACERCLSVANRRAAAAAHYQAGEVHRLRGDYAAAEAEFRDASRFGHEPQPGLALMRAAQGDVEAAHASMRRVLAAIANPLERVRLLPACAEIGILARDLAAAQGACLELEEIAAGFPNEIVQALASQARAAVELEGGDAVAALNAARRAAGVWRESEVPYLEARARVLAGRACRALSDEDGARLELDAAREVCDRLGATPDVHYIDALLEEGSRRPAGALSARELQVLRLVSAGKTNKAIALELSLSEKTVDRHLSNILTKLGVPSRAAATAFGYLHKLL